MAHRHAAQIEAEIRQRLRTCPCAVKGMWQTFRDASETMSNCPGHLLIGENAPSPEQIAAMAVCRSEEVSPLLAALQGAGLIQLTAVGYYSPQLVEVFEIRHSARSRMRRLRSGRESDSTEPERAPQKPERSGFGVGTERAPLFASGTVPLAKNQTESPENCLKIEQKAHVLREKTERSVLDQKPERAPLFTPASPPVPPPSPSLSPNTPLPSSSPTLTPSSPPFPATKSRATAAAKNGEGEKHPAEYRQLTDFWWEKYPSLKNGLHYPKAPAEFSQIGRIWALCNHDLELAKVVMLEYLADKNPYYANKGHPLKLLASDWLGILQRVHKKNGATNGHGSNGNGPGNRAATDREIPDLSKGRQSTGNSPGVREHAGAEPNSQRPNVG